MYLGAHKTNWQNNIVHHLWCADGMFTTGKVLKTFGAQLAPNLVHLNHFPYKKAHTLDKSDPRWLHEKEVDMVKVVLCRFITSQLDAISLRNALVKTCKMNLRQAGNKADKIANALFK